jgi:acyl-ACP thioesterase
MVAPRANGRVFSLPMRPLLADCAPSGRMRLDALARWSQDVAYADIEQAGIDRVAVWVLRRSRIRVERFPRFGERFRVETFASGIGRMWAERRTTVRLEGSGEPVVEAVGLWIHLDPVRWVPCRLSAAEVDLYSTSAGDRSPPHRLLHAKPGDVESQTEWFFRRTDSDVADHINNAAYWEPLEEELLSGDGELVEVDAELEFRYPAQPGTVAVLRAGPYRWITDPDGGELYASIVVTNARTTSGSN